MRPAAGPGPNRDWPAFGQAGELRQAARAALILGLTHRGEPATIGTVMAPETTPSTVGSVPLSTGNIRHPGQPAHCEAPQAGRARGALEALPRLPDRRSSAKKPTSGWASARSATTTGTFRRRSGFANCSTTARSRSGSPTLEPTDPLGFADKKPYRERLKDEQARTGLRDAAIVGTGMIRARRVAFGVTDSAFIMGSMGAVVGEKLTRTIERATDEQLPLIIVSGSGGGARMHEGILSLMQMAKVSAALARYDAAGGLFISVLTNPTMGGVAASFASLGDVIFAEPKALIGFAGPRTIQATIRIELPKGFQTSEFLLEHGFIDRIVRRPDLKSEIARTIDYCGK